MLCQFYVFWWVDKRHIQIKIEHPDNTGFLSLLDFKIQISLTYKICTSFQKKPTTKNFLVHFKSALPFCTKTNYIRNEIKQIHNRCSEEKDKITNTAHFKTPSETITWHLNNKKSQKQHKTSNTCFLKLPYLSEIITKEIHRVYIFLKVEELYCELNYYDQKFLLKKEKCTLYPCSWGYNNYADAYFQSSWEDEALDETLSSVKSTYVTCKTHSG